MIKFSQYISEGIKVQLVRDKGQDVLKMWDTNEKGWVELRGKPGYERNYDSKDPLHKAIDALGKSANISDFMNGEVVGINPAHPHAKKAITTVKRLMK